MERTVKVVPKLVEQSAAPAAKAWSCVAPTRACSVKERAIGTLMPVMATAMDSSRLAFRDAKDVERPPRTYQKHCSILGDSEKWTFVDEQNQA